MSLVKVYFETSSRTSAWSRLSRQAWCRCQQWQGFLTPLARGLGHIYIWRSDGLHVSFLAIFTLWPMMAPKTPVIWVLLAVLLFSTLFLWSIAVSKNYVIGVSPGVLHSETALDVNNTSCSTSATRLHLSDPPYENHFYSDCHSSSHVVVTSPLLTSNLKLIGPRLLIAWPAGNSGIVTFFAPENGVDGSLAIRLENSVTTGEALEPIYVAGESHSSNPRVGVSGLLNLNSSAILTVPILGSIRTIRSFTEAGNHLEPSVQNAI